MAEVVLNLDILAILYSTEGTKVFDSINQIANLFRGSVFYNNNEINFLDDRLREPTALFSNSNVKDGIFSYTNYRRDEQFNAIEVVYVDRFDSFKTKIEYVEDEEDICAKRHV
jgi:predicted phage tail protein